MNDRYLFKAKRKNWRELPKEDLWVQGCYWTNGLGNHFIKVYQDSKGYFVLEDIEVDESTLCQCTGLKDKAKNLIWENDVVEIPMEDGYFSVDWDEDTARFAMNGDGLTVDFDNYWSHEVEVAGNRADNPELLEAE